MSTPSSETRSSNRFLRRAHKKSRTGCNVCRARKVKCDEKKPSCGNCIKYKAQCEYGSLQQPNGAQRLPEMNLQDMELFHNYLTVTVNSMNENPLIQQFYRRDLPQIGFKHPYVMRATLAVAALHLARYRNNEAEELIRLADEHQLLGMKMAAEAFPKTEELGEAHAQFIFAFLNCMCAFARGPRTDSYLIFDAEDLQWLYFYRGVRSIIGAYYTQLKAGCFSYIFERGSEDMERLKSVHIEHKCFDMLCDAIREHASGNDERASYLAEVENLRLFLGPYASYEHRHLIDDSHALTWLYFISDEYIERLQKHEPLAMAIFSHYCVIVHEHQSYWWFRGWAEHLIQGVWALMPVAYRAWIYWPIEKMSWVPPQDSL